MIHHLQFSIKLASDHVRKQPSEKTYTELVSIDLCCICQLSHCGCTQVETMSGPVFNDASLKMCASGNEAALHYFLHYTAVLAWPAVIVHLPTVPLINS